METVPSFNLPVQRAAFGIGLRLLSAICVGVGWAVAKWGGQHGIPTFEVIFFRLAFSFLPLGIYIWRTTGLEVIRTRRPLGHLLRASMGLSALICSVIALRLMPLTEVAALQFASPLFMTLLAAWLLGERVGLHRWGAVALGFVGVLIMVRPTPGHMTLVGVAFALAAALGSAAVMVAIRQLAATERGATIVFWYTAAGTVLGLVGYLVHWVTPDPLTLAILAGGGVITGIGQQLLTESVRVAPIGAVALFDYTQLLWAAALGMLVWGDMPGLYTIAGAVVVVASGAYILRREVRLAAAAPAP